MPKKSRALAVRGTVEVLHSGHKTPDARAAIERLVEQKIAEVMGSGDAIFEPFFRSKQIADEVRRRETVPMQRKWKHYFEKWGCLVCESKERIYQGLGMCQLCYTRTVQRLRECLRAAEAKRPERSGGRDLADVAREALKR